MTTPTDNPLRSESQRSYDSKKIENSLTPALDDPQLETRLDFQIKVCQKERQERLLMLDHIGESTTLQKLRALENDLESLHPLFNSLFEAQKKSDNFAAAFELKNNIERSLKEFKRKYSDIKFDPEMLEAAFNPDATSLDFVYCKEVILNEITNSIVYLKKARNFIQLNQNLIVEKFLQEKVIQRPGFLSIDRIEIGYIEHKAEGHNGGKKPICVSFIFLDKREFKFVCKPRSGEIDKTVIDIFREINQIDAEKRSEPFLLPTYTIINPHTGENWQYLEEMGEISLWEFVDGTSLAKAKANSVGIYIRSLSDVKKANLLEKKLNYLDTILTHLGVIDLHKENVIIRDKPPFDKDPEIVPIDLEAIRKGERTSLGGKLLDKLKEDELACLASFPKKITTIPIRAIPFGTQMLASYISHYSRCGDLTGLLMDQLAKDAGYKISVTKSQLLDWILRDSLNLDIPYFTEVNNIIYYGQANTNRIIGVKELV